MQSHLSWILSRALTIALLSPILTADAASAATDLVVGIDPSSGTPTPGRWYESDIRQAGTATIEDLVGAGGALEGGAPQGPDAVRLTTGSDNGDKAEIAVPGDFGLAGDIINGDLALQYSFYKVSSGSAFAAPAIKLTFFHFTSPCPSPSNDCFVTLVYEPTWNQPGFEGSSTAVPTGSWVDVTITDSSGLFWGTGGFGLPNTAGGPPLRTLAGWLSDSDSAFAGATLVAISVGVGTYNPSQIGYFDDVSLSTTGPNPVDVTWDFRALRDDHVTPDIVFGSGNDNGGFTIDRQGSVEVGLRAKVRFPTPLNVFNSNGDGTYTFRAGVFGAPDNPEFAFEWSVNTDFDGATGETVDDYTYLLEIDFDAGPATQFLAWDPIALPLEPIPFTVPSTPSYYDHAFGDNSTQNGGGTNGTALNYTTLVSTSNVAQNSWRHTFFDEDPFEFDADETGIYDVRLTVFDGLSPVAQSAIKILVDGEVTPDVIFGSGNDNGGFTLDRQGSVEIGLRGKLRFPTPLNVFNNNFDGTYSFLAGEAVPGEASWSFEWSINSDYDGGTGDKIADYTYLLEIDYDSGAGTDFLAWDPISIPIAPIPWAAPSTPTHYDHDFGDNSTPNGGGTNGTAANYATLVATSNVVQNSWRHTFFDEPPFTFDPNAIGRYDVRLTVFDGLVEAAQAEIQIQAVKALTCTLDSECDDGLACNGLESCNLDTNRCEFGSPVVCGGLCDTGACLEPSGSCEVLADGATCAGQSDVCSVADTCQAGVCTEGGGGDSDGDGTCDGDDNCPADQNPGQGDADNDGDGNACDVPDANGFSLSQLLVKDSSRANRDLWKARGDIDFTQTGEMIGVSLPANGLRVTLSDANDVVVNSLTFEPGECQTRGRKVKCKDPASKSSAAFKSRVSPQFFRVSLRIGQQELTLPTLADTPLKVTVTTPDATEGGELFLDRVRAIGDCKSAGGTRIKCKD